MADGMRRRLLLGNWPVVMIMSFVLQQHRSVVPQYRTCAPLWVLRVTRIGRIVVGETVQVLNAAGVPWQLSRKGYQHFID